MKLLYIAPVAPSPRLDGLAAVIDAAKAPDTTVDIVTMPEWAPPHVEYHSYEAVVLPHMLHHVYAGRDTYDGFVMGCFYDLGLEEALELSSGRPVVAPCQATTTIACTLGHRFSILVGRDKWVPKMQANVDRYGHRHHMASMRPLDLHVTEFQTRPDTHERMLEIARQCMDKDGAEVLILGCTAEYGFNKHLENDLGIPVLDPVATSIVYAEFLARQQRNLGWHRSRRGGSEAPPDTELASLGLFKGPPPTGARRRVESHDREKVPA